VTTPISRLVVGWSGFGPPEFLRQELPPNAGAEDEQDAAQHFPVVQALAPSVIGTSRRDR